MPKKPAQRPRTKQQSDPVRTLKKRMARWRRTYATRRTDFLRRRPHRSFQLTRRRDYVRSLELPGYWAFSAQVWSLLSQHRPLFGGLILTTGLASALLVGIVSESKYRNAVEILEQSSAGLVEGAFGNFTQASLLFISGLSGSFSASTTTVQQMFSSVVIIMVWLTTVWLLRAILAGNVPKLRDGLYNSGAPIVGTTLVSLYGLVQLLPVALAFIAYRAAVDTDVLAGGLSAMLFWCAAGSLGLLSVYWMTGTALALVVITLPGMYPWKAIQTSGDIVVGRRIRVLLRIIWMAVLALAVWAIILIPTILFDSWVKRATNVLDWLPLVPLLWAFVSSATIVWFSSYIYLLYRRMIDDNAAPA